jgi:L-Ala-D/L-Glu epimerase
MRLERLSVDVLEVPLRRSLATAGGAATSVRLGLLSLRTDSGSTGVAEVALEAATDADALVATVSDPAAPLPERLVGALTGVDLGRTPPDRALPGAALGEGPFEGALRSALATATADLRAQVAGVPLGEALMGSSTSRRPAKSVAVNALLGIDEATRVAAAARQLVASGFMCLKLKAGAEPPGAVERRVAAVRDSVGRGVVLRLDLNGALDVEGATDLLGRLVPYGLEYVEQPIPARAGVEGLARLRRQTSVAIAADEGVVDPRAAESLVAAGAADVLVVKPARVGGVEAAHQIVGVAQAAGVRVTVACLLESGVGVVAALHLASTLAGDDAHGLSTASWLVSDLLAPPLEVHAGRLSLPGGPGLGVFVDPVALARFRIAGGAWHA